MPPAINTSDFIKVHRLYQWSLFAGIRSDLMQGRRQAMLMRKLRFAILVLLGVALVSCGQGDSISRSDAGADINSDAGTVPKIQQFNNGNDTALSPCWHFPWGELHGKSGPDIFVMRDRYRKSLPIHIGFVEIPGMASVFQVRSDFQFENFPLFSPIPVNMRFRMVTKKEIEEAIATANRLKYTTFRNNKAIVLYCGASDALVQRVVKGLRSPEVLARREAAWLAGWTEDVRMLIPLSMAAEDSDEEVEKQVLISAVRLNLSAFAVGVGEMSLPLLEKAMKDKDAIVRGYAVDALGWVGTERALALVRRALIDEDTDVRYLGIDSLGRIGGDTALEVLEKAITNIDPGLRRRAAHALGVLGGDNAYSILVTAMNDSDDPNGNVRYDASRSLAQIGGEKALVPLCKALVDSNVWVRYYAVESLDLLVVKKSWTYWRSPW